MAAMMNVMQTELKETKDKNTELESRLTDNYKDSIQADNRAGFQNIRERLREKVSITDLPKFK